MAEKKCKSWNSAEKLWATKSKQGYNARVISKLNKKHTRDWVVVYTKKK